MKSRNFPIGDNFKVYKHKYTNFFIESNRECEKKVILPTNQKQRETFRMNRLAIKMQKYHVVLGSASPRRRELLAGLNIPFDIVVKDTTEKVDEHLSPEKISESIAEQKFEAFLPDLQENDFLITADTLVYLDGKTMGKPKSADDARNMIRALSGKTHSVVTAVCIGTVRGRSHGAADPAGRGRGPVLRLRHGGVQGPGLCRGLHRGHGRDRLRGKHLPEDGLRGPEGHHRPAGHQRFRGGGPR